jgi:energy-coupling factor transporter transmembrane protein EcfT
VLIAPGSSRDGLLARVDPTVKLVALLAAAGSLVFVFDPWTPAVLYVIACLGLVMLGRVPIRTAIVRQAPFAVFAASVLWVNLFFRPGGEVVWAWGPLVVTTDGLSLGASLALRTLVIGVYSLAFVLTTDPSRLVASLVQNARVPARGAYGMLAAYRFLPILQDEWRVLRYARRSRGVDSGGPAGWLTSLLPLLVSAIRRSERIAIALESRGLGARRTRTFWYQMPVRPADLVFLVAVVAVALGVPLLFWQLGLFRGFEAITVF